MAKVLPKSRGPARTAKTPVPKAPPRDVVVKRLAGRVSLWASVTAAKRARVLADTDVPEASGRRQPRLGRTYRKARAQ